jgi:hypothetical protein
MCQRVEFTGAALAIRLRAPQSFREKSQQLSGISAAKKRVAKTHL